MIILTLKRKYFKVRGEFLYRIRDFKYLDVYDEKGKKVGVVKDVAINYNKKIIDGFIISTKIFSKKNYVRIQDIVAIGESIISKKVSIYNGIRFGDIKGIDIINKNGNLLGTLDEFLINEIDFSIKCLIVSTGTFYKFVTGKKIFLLEDTILGNKNILYCGNEDICLKLMPYNFRKQVNDNGIKMQ